MALYCLIATNGALTNVNGRRCNSEMKMQTNLIELVAEQSDELPSPQSIVEGLGLIVLQLHRLNSELAKPESDQDAETLFHELIALSAIAMTVAGNLLLPEIERGTQ